ncbi:MAG: MutS-related protein [Thermoplasmatota archaeon]
MEQIDRDLSRLRSVKGMGEGRLASLIRGSQGESGLASLLESGDVSRLSSVEGVSQRMAVELVLAYKGLDPGTVLGTEATRQIYDSIMEVLKGHMHTETSKNRAQLLVPGGELKDREREARTVHSYSELLRGRERRRIEALLEAVSRKGHGKVSRKKDPYILVVEDEEAYQGIRKRGLDSTCMVLSPDELAGNLEGDIVLVHSKREIDEEVLPIVSSVHYSSPEHEIIPERAMDGLMNHLDRIRAVSELRALFGEETICGKAVELIDELSALSGGPMEPDDIRRSVEEVRLEVEGSLKTAIAGLTLSGDDALMLLAAGETAPLKEIYREHARMAADLVWKRLGVKKDLFRVRYPLEIDEESLERMINGIREKAAGDRFRTKVALGRQIFALKEEVLKELDWAVDLDWRFGLGCFVTDLSLAPFEVVEDFFAVKGAADIHLRMDGQFQAVDYHLGPVPEGLSLMFPDREISGSRSAMLTGANSGGKTTLLMTLAQTVIMARMGLPVPAERAFIPDIAKVFIYKPKRRLDAGGLENFLKELLPLSMKVDGSSLVLADELEAMTELEAASRIIGVFIEELSSRGAYSVVVTHMADEIGKYTGCRVDGIEARGLDDKHNLIVDRTPVIGLHARSTPELILKKLHARARGEEKEIYTKVLRRFE